MIAKVTVEIMKREWPQNWPEVIKNLSEISQKGVRHITFEFTPGTDHLYKGFTCILAAITVVHSATDASIPG